MRDLKATVWPSGTRAFSYDCWPGTLQPRTDNALTVSINVIPTLAPIAGAKIGADIAKKLDGHSLAEHLKSNAGVFQRDRLLFKHGGRWESGFAEKHKHNQAAVHHRDLMAIRIDSDCGCKEGICVRGRAISNGQFKPMVYTSRVEGTAFYWAVINDWSLHNVKRDPECRNNLAATDAKTLERLSTAYDQWLGDISPKLMQRGNDAALSSH